LNETGPKYRLSRAFTDLGDGWEREGENAYFSRELSRKKAYPMGINIVLYALSQ